MKPTKNSRLNKHNMSAITQKIVPNFWFNDQAEEAVNFYTSIFKNSQILNISHYGLEGQEIHRRPQGSVMTIEFELEGQKFTALNGGPVFKLTEAISLIVNCDTQDEIDYYWEKLSEGGDIRAQQCGWLKDKYGLSWQVVPVELTEMNSDPHTEKTERLMKAVMSMKKFDIIKLRKAFEGL